MTRFVLLALVAFSLAACETATTNDVALRGDASRTVRHHKPMVRGPVVPDRVEAATRSASASYVPRVVPNPLSRTASVAPAATVASTPSAVPQTAPTEPIQSTSATASQPAITELPSEVAPALSSPTMGAYPTHDSSLEAEPSAPITLGLDGMTPDKIEAMFGGMPFLLIAAIAAALMATLGLALRRPAREGHDYADHGDNVDHLDDHREPYAA